MFKNQLQELAQRSCFNFPSYACIREGPDHAPRFKATVNFNGEVFESPTFCSTLRQAEHSAAEAALDLLSKKGPSKALASKVLDETGVYKNLLQETTHKAGLKLPVYTTVRSGPGHVTLFSCMVDLAGMSFTGEPAKTKKQAQKNAAIAAWTALKQISRSSSSVSSSSSSSASLEPGLNEESEQITVSRYLATLRPPKINRAAEIKGHEQRQSGILRRDLIPFRDETMQNQSWVYPYFSQEMTLSPNRPQFFPLIRSIFQPNHGQCFPFVPEMGPVLYLSNSPNIFQVTMQEIEGNQTIEENWLQSNANPHCWPIKFPSNPSGFLPPTEVPTANSLIIHSDQRIPEILPENAKEMNLRLSPTTGNTVQFKANPTFPPQNPQSLNYLQDNHRPCLVNSPDFTGTFRLSPSSASPVTVRTPNAVLSGSFENSHHFVPAPPSTRASVSVHSTRPWRGNIRCNPSANFMAPAVNIRSVMPVCSSPPAKNMSFPCQPIQFSGPEKSRTNQQEGNITATSSQMNQLQMSKILQILF